MKSYEVVGYAFDAELHCVACTLKRHPDPETARDSEGNELGPVFAGDEPGDTGDFCADCLEPLDNMPDEISERALEEEFDEMLDDCYENVSVAGLEFSTSDALKRLDPVAYREFFLNWINGQAEEGQLLIIGDRYYRY